MHPELDALWTRYGEALIAAGLNVLAAAAILIIGLWVAGWASGAVRRIAKRHQRIDETLAAFFSWMVRAGVTAIVVIAVLHRFGVETTSVVAVFGAAALAIGLALQGTLSNVAAGVMLILFRPYRLGDSVELNGRLGAVSDVNLFVTELITADHAKLVLPNSQCWGAPIQNFTAHADRRVDVDFAAPLSVSSADAIAAAQAALAAEDRLQHIPPPTVLVKSIEHDKTVFTAQGWARAAEQASIKAALLAAIKAGLEERSAAPRA